MNITRSANGSYELTRDDGSVVVLTVREVDALRDYVMQESLRSEVEYAVKNAEDNEDISFSRFADVGDYSSEDDARADFVEHVVEGIVEADRDFDRNPCHSEQELYEIVLDYARDDGWEVTP